MISCYVLSGIPGSGKTTLARQLAEQDNAAVHSYDDMPEANTKASMDGSVAQAWLQAIHKDLEEGKSVICDGINLTVMHRKEILSHIADIPCEKVLCFKIVPLETCLQRNRERQASVPDFVIEQAARLLEPPAKAEGWDKILVYKD